MAGKFQDIIPPEKRSIRNIPIPRRRGSSATKKKDDVVSEEESNLTNTHIEETVTPPEVYDETHLSYNDEEKEFAPTPSINYASKEDKKEPFSYKTHKEFKNLKLWIIASSLIIVLIFIISSLFAKATINITPKKIFVENFEIKAEKTGEGLTYSTITTEETKDIILKGNGEKEVNEKAKGTIIIYNNHSAEKQNLVVNTRFETPEGLIYKLEKAVTVPGQKKDSSGKTTPGSIEATVVASEAGSKYNVGLTDFTVPGFKGDPRFNNVYARSKTNMTGGATGKIAVVSQEDLTVAKESISEEMKEKLKEKIKAEIPADFFLPENAFDIETTFGDPVPSGEGQASIKATSKITAYVFNKSALLNTLSPETIVSEQSDIIFTGGEMNKETLDVTSNKLSGNIQNVQINIVPKIAELKTNIKGKSKKEAQNLVIQNQNIESVRIVVSPIWSMKIPKNEEKINIAIE